MGTGAITAYVDVAQLVLYAFWVFFFALIYYLQRESHREGYPMETDNPAQPTIKGWPTPDPKTYLLPHGGEVTVPNDKVSPQTLNAVPTHRFLGSPLEPVGNPLLAGVGPGAWADRADVPDLTFEGEPKIVPLKSLPDISIAPQDTNPRGLPVVGADGEVGGTVVHIWVDQSEMMVRYLEVETPKARRVLLPINFCRVKRDQVKVQSILGHQFHDVPRTKHPAQVTLLEEEKIMAYYGAGTLYAEPSRAEPLV